MQPKSNDGCCMTSLLKSFFINEFYGAMSLILTIHCAFLKNSIVRSAICTQSQANYRQLIVIKRANIVLIRDTVWTINLNSRTSHQDGANWQQEGAGRAPWRRVSRAVGVGSRATLGNLPHPPPSVGGSWHQQTSHADRTRQLVRGGSTGGQMFNISLIIVLGRVGNWAHTLLLLLVMTFSFLMETRGKPAGIDLGPCTHYVHSEAVPSCAR